MGILYTIKIADIRNAKLLEPGWSKLKMKKITKKFYVGANKVFLTNTYGPLTGKTWAKETIGEAITHAKCILEENPEQEFAFVVQIVRVIKRKNQPLIVEKV